MRRNVAFEDSMMNSITTAVNKTEQWWTLRTLQQNLKWLWQQHDNGVFKPFPTAGAVRVTSCNFKVYSFRDVSFQD